MMFHEFPFCFSLLSASRRPIGALFQKSRRKGNALPSLEFGALGATAPSNGHRSAGVLSNAHKKFFLRALEIRPTSIGLPPRGGVNHRIDEKYSRRAVSGAR